MKKRFYCLCLFNWEIYWSKLSTYNKKHLSRFYDYSPIVEEILSHLSDSEFFDLRLKIYQKYQNYVVFQRFSRLENAIWWKIVREWIKVSSWIFSIPASIFAQLLPRRIRVQYFSFDRFYDKYVLKTDFIYHL